MMIDEQLMYESTNTIADQMHFVKTKEKTTIESG